MKTILIVEDDDDLRVSLADIFRSIGYSAMEANNGLAAIELTRLYQFDLIITDFAMPQMDGYLLTKQLKESGESALILIFTGFSKYTKDDFLKAGASGYLEKPLEIEILVFKIKELFERKF